MMEASPTLRACSFRREPGGEPGAASLLQKGYKGQNAGWPVVRVQESAEAHQRALRGRRNATAGRRPGPKQACRC